MDEWWATIGGIFYWHINSSLVMNDLRAYIQQTKCCFISKTIASAVHF